MKDFEEVQKYCPMKSLGIKKGNRRCDLLRNGVYNPLCREEICIKMQKE